MIKVVSGRPFVEIKVDIGQRLSLGKHINQFISKFRKLEYFLSNCVGHSQVFFFNLVFSSSSAFPNRSSSSLSNFLILF